MGAIPARLSRIPRDLKLFAIATFAIGMASSLFDAVFNNFLNDEFALTGFQRAFLEVPRELPGLLVVFVSAGLWFLTSRRLGAAAMMMGAAGALLVGYASNSYAIMIVWLFIYSLGQHLFFPLASGIGMDLARQGHAGQRLGQFNSIRNLAVILGSATVFLGFKYLGMEYQHSFTLAALGLAIAAGLLYAMKPGQRGSPGLYLKLHREYKWFYLLAVLYGSRKQLFITFAPWVLITIFDQPTTTLATLITIGGIIGILFQPVLGRAIDRFGERVILIAESLFLVLVCFGYGFSKSLFPAGVAFVIVCLCYLMDQMLMSVGIARSTYIKKIARQPDDVQPALTASVTIDHVFSISIALLGGLIWNAFGYQYVFLMGALIACLNFLVALQVRVPELKPDDSDDRGIQKA